MLASTSAAVLSTALCMVLCGQTDLPQLHISCRAVLMRAQVPWHALEVAVDALVFDGPLYKVEGVCMGLGHSLGAVTASNADDVLVVAWV